MSLKNGVRQQFLLLLPLWRLYVVLSRCLFHARRVKATAYFLVPPVLVLARYFILLVLCTSSVLGVMRERCLAKFAIDREFGLLHSGVT